MPLQGLNIDTGIITLPVTRDGENVGDFSFNPNRVDFAERFYAVYEKLQEKGKSLAQQEKEINQKISAERDEFLKTHTEEDLQLFVPQSAPLKIALVKEICQYMKREIDSVFGDGTSALVFGEGDNFDVFGQFFEAITPHVEKARAKKTEKYLGNRAQRRSGLK